MKAIPLAVSGLCRFALALIAVECPAEEAGKMDLSKLAGDYRAVLKSKDVALYGPVYHRGLRRRTGGYPVHVERPGRSAHSAFC
jgi:hypothetical protein